jgi:hypothetical protein
MKYRILTFIPVEQEADDLMDYEEAKALLNQYTLLQPENIYKLIRVLESGLEEEVRERA